MENMLLAMCELILVPAILSGITSIQQLVSALEHIILSLLHNFKKFSMLTGTRHMLFQLKNWVKVLPMLADEMLDVVGASQFSESNLL